MKIEILQTREFDRFEKNHNLMTVCHRTYWSFSAIAAGNVFNRKIKKEKLKTLAFTCISVIISVTTV